MKETGTWSKWSYILLFSGQSLRFFSMKTVNFEGREDLFCMPDMFRVSCFSLKPVDDLLKADSDNSYHVASLLKI